LYAALWLKASDNAADSWWRDPGLRMNVMHCMGLCFCVYYLGCKSYPHYGSMTVSDEYADDASLLTGLQAVPAWQEYVATHT
jgi:hypothetical protein